MKYALLIYTDESQQPTQQVAEQALGEYLAYSSELFESGAGLGGEPLQGSGTATTVRVQQGERLITDGPFAEAREQLAGFYLIEVENLDAALDWAARCPGARYGTVEVRPLLDLGQPAG